MDVPAIDGFFWQLSDPDRPGSFREGDGLEAFIEALRDLTAGEAELTPEGFIPSGNIAIYWSRLNRTVETA